MKVITHQLRSIQAGRINAQDWSINTLTTLTLIAGYHFSSKENLAKIAQYARSAFTRINKENPVPLSAELREFTNPLSTELRELADQAEDRVGEKLGELIYQALTK